MNTLFVILFFLFGFFILFVAKWIDHPILKWLFLLFFCVLVSTRDLYVPDTESYVSYYLSEDPSLAFFDNYGYEIGFQVLTKVIKSVFGDNYTAYFAAIAALNLLILNFAFILFFRNDAVYNEQTLNKSDRDVTIDVKSSILLNILYFMYYGMYLNAITLRVGLAFSLTILISAIAVNAKKIQDHIIILFLLIINYTLHATSVIALPIILILVYSKELKKKTYIISLSLIGIIYFLNLTSRLGGATFNAVVNFSNLSVLSTKLENYSGSSYLFEAVGVSSKFLFYFIMAFVFMLSDFANKFFYKFYNVYIVGLLVYSLFRSVLLIERITDYFFVFFIFCFYIYLKTKKDILFWIILVIVVFVQIVFVMRIINA